MNNGKKDIKRVLLILPFSIEDKYDFDIVEKHGHFVEAPLGLCYIAANLKKESPDIHVTVLDANMMAVEAIIGGVKSMESLWDMLRKNISDFSPDLVGVSCLFHFTAKTSHQTCELIKNTSSDIVTVMGGTYPTISVELALEDKNVDFAVFSEGEQTMVELIRALNTKKDLELKYVDGIAFRANNLLYSSKGTEDIIINEKTKWITNLDRLPFPDRSSIPLMRYFGAGRHFLQRLQTVENTKLVTMTSTRGCPHNCTFCCATKFWGRQIRFRTPKNIVDEMQLMIDQYGANTFVFNDDNLTTNHKFIIELTDEIIQRKIDICWTTGGGFQLSSLKPDAIQNIYKSGGMYFSLAIESGVKSTLKKIRKPLNLDAVSRVISDIHRYGDGYTLGFFITGFPFETKKDIEKTLEYAGSLDLDWRQFSAFQPLPGTDDYDTCVKKGYINPFDIKWGDYAMSVNLNTENFSADWLFEKNYLANLEYNFLKNRNLQNGNVNQAVRDFEYVLKFVPDHAIAYYSLGNALSLLEDDENALNKWKLAADIVEKDSLWDGYFNKLGIDLSSRL